MNNKHIFLFFLFFVTTSSFSQAIKDNLILFYPFNNNLSDQSGNQNHGINNGVKFSADRFYINKSSTDFNGSSDFIELPNIAALKPDFPFAISFWVLFYENPDVPKYIFRSDNYDNAYSGFWIGLTTSGQLSTGYGDGAGKGFENRYSKYSNKILELNYWHNIVVSFNSTDSIKIFIDCKLEKGSLSGGAYSLNNLGYSGAIGKSFNRFFKGKIDDLRLYSKEIKQKDIPYLCYENPYFTDTISVTDTLFIDVTFTGTFEQETIQTIKVYPNPAKKIIYIDSGKGFTDISNYSIKIITSEGQIIYKSKINSKILHVDVDKFMKTGLYLIQILNKEGQLVEVRKLVLN